MPERPSYGALTLVVVCLMLTPWLAGAQDHGGRTVPADAAGLGMAAASRAAGSIVLDGRLSEEAWTLARPADAFLQREPDEGKPATERTEIRVVYDADALYIGARMFDSEPGRIVRRLVRRDTEPQSDSVTILLDPHHDHRSGYSFRVAASGAVTDRILYNDTNQDDSWDGVWDAAVSVDELGWTAEIRIPFSQLRYGSQDDQTWGFNAIRYVQRRNEEDWWQLVPTKETRFVSQFGHLGGLTGIRTKSHLELLPYASGGAEATGSVDSGDPYNSGAGAFAGAGLDLKWGLTNSMTLDGAVNPDFGQVEVDPAVVNLTAFETFYQEKRPFFLEGANLYTNFGRSGLTLYGRFGSRYPSLYYSRRIGRAPQGLADGEFVDMPDATTILGAAKLSGQTASGWSIAALDAFTSREQARFTTGATSGSVDVEPATNYFAGRARRDFGQRGGIGVIGTSVERNLGTDALASRLVNRAYAVGSDGHVFLDAKRNWVVSGSGAGTWVSGDESAITRLQRSSARYYQRPDADHTEFDPTARSLSGWSGEVNLNKTTGNLLVDGAAWAVSPGFESNDIGYSPSADRIGAHVGLILRKPTPDRFSRNRELTFIKYYNWNFQGDVVGDYNTVQGYVTWPNYWSTFASVGYQPRVYDDRFTRGGPVVRRFDYRDVSAGVSTDRRKAVSFDVSGSYGANLQGGWASSVDTSVTVRPSPSLSLSVGPVFSRGNTIAQYVRSVADDTATATYGGRYVFANLDQTEIAMSTRVNWTLSPRMSLQVYAQPLLSVGDYTGYKELAQPRTFDFSRYGTDVGTISNSPENGIYTVDPDGSGPARSFAFSDPSFNFRSIRLNTVFRWEWRLGSTLYVVWTQQREDYETEGRLLLGHDLRSMFRAPGDNVFMVKMTYWLSR